MANSYVACLIHCVFSTKGRRNLITPDIRNRLWSYIGGIARENSMSALAVGGTLNHVHVLLSIPQTMSIAQVMQKIKGVSSKWVHDEFPKHRDFKWQKGYGAFGIGLSQMKRTVEYIENQEEHHKGKTFEQEFVAFLKKNDLPYDERYIFD
jgi:REP-associated tyrosine transposase